MKVGVGKTTLTANLAWAMTRLYDKNVLLVDVDMQANLSQYFHETSGVCGLGKPDGQLQGQADCNGYL